MAADEQHAREAAAGCASTPGERVEALGGQMLGQHHQMSADRACSTRRSYESLTTRWMVSGEKWPR
nr:hypothetical protein [Streptomyces antimycoticus]